MARRYQRVVATELRKYGLRYEDLLDPKFDLVSSGALTYSSSGLAKRRACYTQCIPLLPAGLRGGPTKATSGRAGSSPSTPEAGVGLLIEEILPSQGLASPAGPLELLPQGVPLSSLAPFCSSLPLRISSWQAVAELLGKISVRCAGHD